MEIAVAREALRQQFGADDLAVLENQASPGLMGEQDTGDAGDNERIAQAQQDRGDQGVADRCLPNGMHGNSPRGRLRPPCLR